MRTISALALAACALGLPGVLRAAELTFGADGAAEYDSNVFRSSDDEESDVVFRLRPWVQLAEQRGQDFNYSLTYGLPFDFAVEHSDINDVDQELYAEGAYHVNDQLALFASNNFRYIRSELRTNFDGTEAAFDSPLVNNERDRLTINDAAVGARYQFTPRLGSSLELQHDYFDTTRDDRQKYWQIQGIGNLLYTITPKLRLGGGGRVAHQNFKESQDILGSTAQIYSVFASARYAFDEKTEISANVGPALIQAQEDDADEMETRDLIPFTNVSGRFRAPNGFVDRDGGDVSGVQYNNGVMLVSRLSDCPTLRNSSERVLVSNQSCNPSVVLDRTLGTDEDLIEVIEAASASVLNTDPDGDESTEVTVFADVVVTRHWTEHIHSAIHYTREQEAASGLGGSVVGDSLALSNTWIITEKWQLAGRGEWGLRTSVQDAGQVVTDAVNVPPPLGGQGYGPFGDLPVPPGPPNTPNWLAGVAGAPDGQGTSRVVRGQTTDIDTMRWGVATRLTRFFTRNTSGYLQFTYNQQGSQNDSLGDPSDFEDYIATVGVQHVFSPIKIW